MDPQIKSYISTFSNDVQEILRKLRVLIRSVSPELTEGISYGIPTFYYKGKYLIYFAAFKNHISVYPATTPAVEKVKGLSKYKVSKGTLRFPLDKPIPYDLVKEFVDLRLKEQE